MGRETGGGRKGGIRCHAFSKLKRFTAFADGAARLLEFSNPAVSGEKKRRCRKGGILVLGCFWIICEGRIVKVSYHHICAWPAQHRLGYTLEVGCFGR